MCQIQRTLYLCVLLVFLGCWRVSARTIPADNEIDGKDGCVMNGKTYKLGEKWSVLGECNVYTCQEEGGVSALPCPVITFAEGSGCYETDMDLTKMYPECCPQIVCKPSIQQ